MDDEGLACAVCRDSRGKRDRGQSAEGAVLGVSGDDNSICTFDVKKNSSDMARKGVVTITPTVASSIKQVYLDGNSSLTEISGQFGVSYAALRQVAAKGNWRAMREAGGGENLGGRSRKPIDYKTLDGLCAIQCTEEECAAVLDMSVDSLNNKLKEDGNGGFSDYFRIKSSNGKVSLRRRQWAMAVDNPTMAIWLGKQYLRQADKRELTGKDGGPMESKSVLDTSKLSTDVLRQIMAAKDAADEL